MNIRIAIRFRPFSHLPGTRVLIPMSRFVAECYPTRFVIYDYATARPEVVGEHQFTGLGPLEQFTVTQDLERGHLLVSGFTKGGVFRYRLCAALNDAGWCMEDAKAPKGVLPPRERLSLGCSKAQDWPMVLRRRDLAEMLPFWFWLAQVCPQIEPIVPAAGSLVHMLQEQILHPQRHELEKTLLALLFAGVSGLLVPRLYDNDYQGFASPLGVEEGSPLALFQATWPLLRRLFFYEEDDCWHILPCVPISFHAGRLLSVTTGGGHELAFEWTKKCIRRLFIRAAHDATIALAFQRDVRTCRVYERATRRMAVRQLCPVRISLEKGKTYILDNFET